MKILLILFVAEIFVVGFLVYRRFSKKKVQPVLPDSEMQLIQKEIREFEAERRRSGFQRI